MSPRYEAIMLMKLSIIPLNSARKFTFYTYQNYQFPLFKSEAAVATILIIITNITVSHKLVVYRPIVPALGLSQMCSKFCPKCFQKFPKNSPIMLLSVMLLSCQQFLALSLKFYVMTALLQYFTTSWKLFY